MDVSVRRAHDRAARAKPRILRKTLAIHLLQVAMLGGYLARNHDPPPGNMVVWRGLTHLNKIISASQSELVDDVGN